ncbi:MAG: PIN domain-containing protein [Solirubrobacterales bacterium]|nr:PIN domain-containing protein [Solirubrobacterales bacterium]
MGLVIDTSIAIKLEREGPSENFRPVFNDEQISISVITVSELLAGVYRCSDERRIARMPKVEEMLSGLAPLPITPSIARIHADLSAYMSQQGRSIGRHDEWIAATAIAHGATVVTLNRKDFEKVPGLTVVSPTD